MHKNNEYISRHLGDFEEHAERTLTCASPSTILAYLSRFNGIVRRCKDERWCDFLYDEIQRIDDKRRQGNLKHSSLRQYRSCLGFGLSLAVCDNLQTGELFGFRTRLLCHLSAGEAKMLYEKLYSIATDDSGDNYKFREMSAHQKARTTSGKLKHIPQEYLALFERYVKKNNTQSNRLAYLFLSVNIHLGLRPAEWFYAKLCTYRDLLNDENYLVLSDTVKDIQLSEIEPIIGQLYLVVKNFKNSQGRACGDYRYICLDDFSQAQIRQIREMMNIFHRYIQKIKAKDNNDFYDKVMRNLQGAIRRANHYRPIRKLFESMYQEKQKKYQDNVRQYEKNGKVFLGKPAIMQFVVLYSSRHQAIANAKSSGLSVLQIAALFGHSSIHTAHKHYAKAKFGNGGFRAIPHLTNMKMVIMKSIQLEQVVSNDQSNQVQNTIQLKMSNENDFEM
ncbi:hypothetical protein LP092_15105 (plasmid) [Moraxella bovis]|uniref:Site-specific recombinase XerD n=1 Tax=Moraxella bovis TaxID=476 RepID=A0ABY6MD04_MORBO|nr:hypothetical protein [Moraxella bovis]UZA04804.1 hypothetical protein LP092_15105 [Moraxella bovis]